jgi:excisionase family DNA binding protein
MSAERLTYKVKEAIEASGLSRTTLYGLIKTGKLAAVRVGRRVLIPREALHALLGRAA